MPTPTPPDPLDSHLLTGVAGLAVSVLIFSEAGVRVTLVGDSLEAGRASGATGATADPALT